MAKHKPSVLYCTHKFGVYPNGQVKTVDSKRISFSVFFEKGKHGFGFTVSRQLAKMLARRINQCLEDTK